MELFCEKNIREEKEIQKIVKEYEEAVATGNKIDLKAPDSCPPVPEPPVVDPNQARVRLIDQKNRKQPPIVISKKRFATIYAHATNAKEARDAAEIQKEEFYKQYLKEGSDELVQKFGGNFKRTQEQRLQEMKLAMEEKNKHHEAAFKGLTEQYAQERYEKIQKAQKILESMKAGPRELRSAALETEIINARNTQLAIRKNYEKAIKKQEELDKQKCVVPTNSYNVDDEKRTEERLKRWNNYKFELKETIDRNHRVSLERRRQELKEAIAEREALGQVVKKEIAKEKAAMRRKVEMNRKNALEAMKMVEQRRLRNAMIENIEGRVNCVFNAGAHQLRRMLKDHTQQLRENKERIHDETVKLIHSMRQEDPRSKEDERLKRDISYMRLKFTAEEEKKKEKMRLAKQARIEDYLREVQEKKKAQALAEEQTRFEMAERFKNTEVNSLFNKRMQEEKLKKSKEMQEAWAAQVAENQRINRFRGEGGFRDCISELRFIKDDRRFYEYAAELMEDARKKGRSLLPFIKVVQQYKKDSGFDKKTSQPKHMATHIVLGKDEIPEKATHLANVVNMVRKAKIDVCELERKSTEDNIAANIARIEKMIAEEAAERKKPCPSFCPIDCNRHKSMNTEPTPSERLRYSVWELKQLNQYDSVGDCVNQPQQVLG